MTPDVDDIRYDPGQFGWLSVDPLQIQTVHVNNLRETPQFILGGSGIPIKCLNLVRLGESRA